MARHVHADLMIEAAEDTSIEWQVRCSSLTSEWRDSARPSWSPDLEYRKKPREFQEGHWYPVVDQDDDKGIYMYNGESFEPYVKSRARHHTDKMKWIGESLGKIEFGGK